MRNLFSIPSMVNRSRQYVSGLTSLILFIAGGILFQPMRSQAQGNVLTQQPAIGEEESGDEIMEREVFFHLKRAGGPDKTIPSGAYESARQQSVRMQKDRNLFSVLTSGSNWVSVNPTGLFYNRTNANYISGRTNSFAFHPTDPNTFYVAAAGGGIWKTSDGGVHFLPMTDNISSLTSGAVAVDPTNGNEVYAATGELNYSLDSYYGDGIFKSTDAGSTWTKVATTSIGHYFSAVIVNPQNSNIVYAGGASGVYKSTNGGGTWSYTGSNTYANSLVMDPTNPQTLYAATGFYNANIIRKTTDGGATWTTLSNGLPPSYAGRTTLAISASNPSTLYASIAVDTSYGLLGLYRTIDGGNSWTLQNSSVNYLGSQGWYDNMVTVNPTNPNLIVVGGLDVYSSSNGGVTLTQKSVWYTSSSGTMTHADIHFLGYNGSILYCGSDGGAYKSTNDGTTWSDLNQTISTLQFQSADYDPSNIQRMYGGCQDNDKEYTTNGGTSWIQRTTGDGGYTIVDPINTNYIYGQYVGGSLQRSSNYGLSYSEISPNTSTGGLFYNPYQMAPGDHNTIVFGRADVWKTITAQTATTSAGWTQIATTSVVNGNVSSIGISTTTTNKIYIGTDNGKILITTNNGATWSTVPGFPYVSDLAVDNINDSVCYATCTGFSASQHVYKTTNSGTTWSNISGNLPNIPVNTVIVRSATPRTIFVGTDLGVYESTNEGTSWVSFNSGLPAVEIFDLKYRESNHLLLAATHGRGCFTFDLSGLAIQRTLTINSSTPSSGIPVTVTPNDINSNGNAVTPATRLYYDQTSVSLTAAATQGVNYFSKWMKDGVNFSASQTINVLMDTDHAVTAVYALAPTVTLTVTSSTPNSGVAIVVNPSDNLAQASGTTPLSRYYLTPTVVSLTAPHAAGGNYFLKWTKDGANYATDTGTTVTMDAVHTLTAVYGSYPIFQSGTDSIYVGHVKSNHSTIDSLTVTNAGNVSLSISSVIAVPSYFSVTPSVGVIPPSGSMKFYVTFLAPPDNARHNGHLIFSHNAAGSPDSVILAGDSYDIFTAQPETLQFGDVFTGSLKTDSLAIVIGTNDTMTISSIVSDNSVVVVAPASGIATPSKPCTVHVTFQPLTTGVQTSHLIFTHNKLGSPDTAFVLGRGVAAQFSAVPSTISFGPVTVSTTKTDSITVSNPGTGQLIISSVVSNDSSEFAAMPVAPVIVPPAQSTKFYVGFHPSGLGPKSAHLRFYHNASTSPDTVQLSGSGAHAGFSLSKLNISFGEVIIATTKIDSVVVTNTDLGTLVIDSVYSDDPAEFSAFPNKAISVSPGGSQTIYTGFTPANGNPKTANLIFVHNAPGSPDSLVVSGSGKQGETVISFGSEWNMVSIPISVANWSRISIFPTSTSAAFIYAGSYYLKDTLAGGVGYWIRFSSAGTDTLTGIPIVGDTLTVSAGWNMIGAMYQPVAISSITSDPPGMTTSNYFGYDGSYKHADTLYPGKGYWVKTSSSGSLILSSASLLSPKPTLARTRIVSISELPPSPPERVLEDNGFVPKKFSLDQAYPNPFNPTTTIRFDLTKPSLVTLKVYNMLGEVVGILRQNARLDAGRYENIFSAMSLSSGVYYYSIYANSTDGIVFHDVKKMILMK
jgi:photosystem II stability/assembly factor-like uncharacterized protein